MLTVIQSIYAAYKGVFYTGNTKWFVITLLFITGLLLIVIPPLLPKPLNNLSNNRNQNSTQNIKIVHD